jgi:glutamate---cysteine ligase / carboxylate-amine ligase
MRHRFGHGPAFTVGIEEEFQLVSAESYELVPRFDEVAAAAADERVRQELMTSVLEAATGVHERVADAVDEVGGIRARLRDAAAEHGALIAAAGTHPFSRWEHQEITDSPRYQGVVDELRWVAEQVAIFGLHVHVGMPSSDAAIAVANAFRTHVPELLALSANSPFWQGRDTGLASTRSKIFETMPRSGLPPAFKSFAEFEELVRHGRHAGLFDDYTFLWWDVRPHPNLGTVELRMFDAQTRLESVAALAALAQSLAATFAEDASPVEPRTLIAENKWRAARYGLAAELVDLARDSVRPAREALAELVAWCRPAAERLGCGAELDQVSRVCERGEGATEQRRIQDEAGSLLAVAQWLARTTVADLN